MLLFDTFYAFTVDSQSEQGIECCNERAREEELMHPACRPIEVPEDDPFYSQFGRRAPKCLNFVRNSPSPRPGCTLGPREQNNVLTHYMDGSMVYGSDDDRAASLRLKEKGNLLV